MRTLDVTTKTGRKDLLIKQTSGSDIMRELFHDLMNQLTVIDLCIFQLRAASPPATAVTSPADLAQIARVVEQALRTAKRLSLEISSPTGKPGEHTVATPPMAPV
jgi:hypothetical protein